MVSGADQRPSLQAVAGERRTDLQHQLRNHRLLPVALCQAAPQRDGPHSHTPHTLCLLLTSWLAALHTVSCTSQCALVPSPGIKAKHVSVPNICRVGFSLSVMETGVRLECSLVVCVHASIVGHSQAVRMFTVVKCLMQ